MREYIDILREAEEVNNVVDLRQHKTAKAFSNYLDAVSDVYQGEADFFASGKFMPFAQAYIEQGFAARYRPEITITVHFRDWRPSPVARELIRQLRAERFKYQPATPFAKGSKPKDNVNQEAYGPWLSKEIDLNQAKAVFQDRAASPYGAYQQSRAGFRYSHKNVWDDRGVGFNLTGMGYDCRRGDCNDWRRQETHIIDDDKDMTEVVNMFAAIRRAQIKSV